MVPDKYELFISHNYAEDSLVASSSVLHEEKHPETGPPSGHPHDGKHLRLNMLRLTLLFGWLLLIEVC